MYSRKIVYSGLLIVAALAFAAACTAAAAPASVLAGGGPGGAQPVSAVVPASATNAGGITVVGVGKASGTPDVAHITVGVETVAASVQQAVNDNKAKMTALLGALKDLGIADKDIRTDNYSVFTERLPVPVASPAEKPDSGPLAYHVNNQVNVTVRDVSKLGDTLDKAVAAGANNVYGVSFSVDDPSKLQADARAEAVADAKARAQDLAKLAGVNLGDVVSISEVIGGPGPVFSAAAPVAMGMGGGGAPIQPGEQQVNISVQVTFAIK